MRRVLAIARNIDTMPPGAIEIFGSLQSAGPIPNDGAFHDLVSSPAALSLDPTYRVVVRYVRVEWSTLDLSVPPPLTLQMFVAGASPPVAFQALASVMLLAVAPETPAIEFFLHAVLEAGSIVFLPAGAQPIIGARIRNTGAVAQNADVLFWGWAYPQTLPDGAGYGDI